MQTQAQPNTKEDSTKLIEEFFKTLDFTEILKENMRDEFYYGKYDTRLSPEDV